jgi:putative lipoic acid-binding regulatory protein
MPSPFGVKSVDPLSRERSLELLEATHHFPGPYVFKAIGRVERAFAARVVAAVRDELGASIDPPFKTRTTAGGRHVAVTVEPTLLQAEEVLAVYDRLAGVAGLVMLF